MFNLFRWLDNSNMDSFVDQLHARNQAIPAAAGRKRLTVFYIGYIVNVIVIVQLA